jgi:hypothetical protein
MIESLYSKYFQKSRSFLYPILGIKKKNKYTPTGTYIALPDKYDASDMKLIVTFKTDNSPEFQEFENKMLVGNSLFLEKHKIRDYTIYVFSFDLFQSDWTQFLLGRYSKLSATIKKAIKVYYGESSTEYTYIDSYLYPEKYFEVYAKLLDVDIKDLKQVGELCDSWDLDKETLRIPVEFLEVIKKEH